METKELLQHAAQEQVAAFNGEDQSPVAVYNMIALLRETEHLHSFAEQRLPKHDWKLWYAQYMVARQATRSEADSSLLADSWVLSFNHLH